MKKNLYIGEFPPPMGGVTVKNELIKNKIYNADDMDFFDLYSCKRNPLNLLRLILKIICVKGMVILGVGSNKRLERLMQIIKKTRGSKKLNQCSIIMMGSTLQNYAKQNVQMVSLLRDVKAIFTESRLINADFQSLGIKNTHYFPNCRVLSHTDYSGKTIDVSGVLKLVFFSRICKEKGAHYLFEVVDKLNEAGISVQLDYYGVIASEYKNEFESDLKRTKNISYRGIFDASKEDVYQKLNEYDLLLFPTTWIGEGIPGILVESKIAGIPAIVTEHNYNCEVIHADKEGIVVSKEDIVQSFTEAIIKIHRMPEMYEKLARGAWESRSRYDIKEYRTELRSGLRM